MSVLTSSDLLTSPKHTISRSSRVRVHVARIYTTRIAHSIDCRQCCCSLGRRSWQRVGNPSQCDNITSVYARHHDHHSEIARASGGSGGADYEGNDTDVEGKRYVEVALARAIGVPGVKKGSYNAENLLLGRSQNIWLISGNGGRGRSGYSRRRVQDEGKGRGGLDGKEKHT